MQSSINDSGKGLKLKIFFEQKDPVKIVDKIMGSFDDPSLKKMVKFEVQDDQLVVTISKLGTSKLIFDWQSHNNGTMYKLAEEKIAIAHRAFKDEVTQGILKTIQKAGGKIDG